MSMKAIGIMDSWPIEHPDSLLDIEVEKPTAEGRDLLVQVKAVSVNPIDTKIRTSNGKQEDSPRILGWDVAGVVEAVGADCTLFKPGDEVYYAGSLIRQGCNSEYHLVDERIVGKKPTSLDFASAAALPLTSITAWEALFDRLLIEWKPGENAGKTILIIGAAGGVGSIAVQLANLAGLKVIGTASRPQSAEWVKEKGADLIINHHQAFVPQLREIGIHHVNYILCLNDTDIHWDNMVETIAPQGKICAIVGTSKPLNLTDLMGKSATFVWELMYTRSTYGTPDMIEQHNLLNRVSALIDEGLLSTTVTEVLTPINAHNLKLAHKQIESASTIGKIVVKDF